MSKEIKFNILSGFHLGRDNIDIEVFYFKDKEKIAISESFKNGLSIDILIGGLKRMKEFLLNDLNN